MKLLLTLFIFLTGALNSFAETEESIDVTQYLTETEKHKLLSDYIEEGAKRDKQLAVMSLLSDIAKAPKVIELIQGGYISPYFKVGLRATLIEHSTLMNNYQVVKYLLESYEYPAAVKLTIYEMACANGHLNIIDSLADNGVDLNSRLPSSQSYCLFLALDDMNAELISYLKDKNANFDIRKDTGLTPKIRLNEIEMAFRKITSIIEKNGK